MNFIAVSVRDGVLGHFNPPIFVRSVEHIKRELKSAFQNRSKAELPSYLQSAFDYPKDCALYEIGVFNDEDGSFEMSHEFPNFLFNFTDICV